MDYVAIYCISDCSHIMFTGRPNTHLGSNNAKYASRLCRNVVMQETVEEKDIGVLVDCAQFLKIH